MLEYIIFRSKEAFILIKTTSVHEFAYEKLKAMIISKQYKEGDFLPAESELSKQLGVTIFALKEALLLMRKIGIVEVRQGKYIKIKKEIFFDEYNSLVNIINENKHRTLDLLGLRKCIEVEAAGLAAERATEEQITELRGAYSNIKNKANLNKYNIDLDINFHIVLVKISTNRLFIQIMLSLIKLQSDSFCKVEREILNKPVRIKAEWERHERLLAAIEKKDRIKAREIAAEYFEGRGRI